MMNKYDICRPCFVTKNTDMFCILIVILIVTVEADPSVLDNDWLPLIQIVVCSIQYPKHDPSINHNTPLWECVNYRNGQVVVA